MKDFSELDGITYTVPEYIQHDIEAAAAVVAEYVGHNGIAITGAPVEGSGLANGYVVLSRKTRLAIDGKSQNFDLPVAVIPINGGHRFPTRFTDGYVYDRNGGRKLTKAGAPVVNKVGIKKFFTTHYHEQLVEAVYEAVSSGEWEFTLIYNKIVK